MTTGVGFGGSEGGVGGEWVSAAPFQAVPRVLRLVLQKCVSLEEALEKKIL